MLDLEVKFDELQDIYMFKVFPHRLFISYKDKKSNCKAEKADNTLMRLSKLTSTVRVRQTSCISRCVALRSTQRRLCRIQAKNA